MTLSLQPNSCDMGITTTLKVRDTSITKQAQKPKMVMLCRRGQQGSALGGVAGAGPALMAT